MVEYHEGVQGFGYLLTSGFKILHVVGHRLRSAFVGANFDSIWEQNRSPPSKQPPALCLCGLQKLPVSGRQGRVKGLLRQEQGDCTRGFLYHFWRKDSLLVQRTAWKQNRGLPGKETQDKRQQRETSWRLLQLNLSDNARNTRVHIEGRRTQVFSHLPSNPLIQDCF